MNIVEESKNQKLTTFDKLVRMPTLLTASITVLAYYFAYRYESGYLSHFDISTQLIQISLQHFVESFLRVLALAFLILIAYRILHILLQVIGIQFPSSVPGFALLVVSFIGYSINTEWNIVTTGQLILALALVTTDVVHASSYKEGKYKKFKIKHVPKLNESKTEYFYNNIISDKNISFIILLILIFPLTFFTAGSREAERKEVFDSLHHEKDWAIIRIYGNVVVTKDYDSKNKEVGNVVKLFNLGDLKEYNITKIDVDSKSIFSRLINWIFGD